jgi:hypothetical protein
MATNINQFIQVTQMDDMMFVKKNEYLNLVNENNRLNVKYLELTSNERILDEQKKDSGRNNNHE